MMSRHCPSTLPFRQIRPYQRRYAPADQRGLQHLLLLRRGRDQQPHLSLPFLDRYRNPIAEENRVRRKRRHHLPRRDDPGKVERIGPAHRDELFRFPFPVSRFPPNGAQRPHRLRQRILLSGEPAHEPTAPDLAPGFEPPVHAQDVPPRREQALTLEQPAEHHPGDPQARRPRGLNRGGARLPKMRGGGGGGGGSAAASAAGDIALQTSPLSLLNSAIGLVRIGPDFVFRVPTSAFRAGLSRPHAISPERHSPSSHSGS